MRLGGVVLIGLLMAGSAGAQAPEFEAGGALQSLLPDATATGLRFGLKARIVPMSEAEACIDADKPSDIELIERIFAARRQAAIGQPL